LEGGRSAGSLGHLKDLKLDVAGEPKWEDKRYPNKKPLASGADGGNSGETRGPANRSKKKA